MPAAATRWSILRRKIGAEHRVLQHFQSGASDVGVDRLKRARIGRCPTLQGRRAGRNESWNVGGNFLGTEQRRKQPPLPSPALAFGDEDPLAAALAQHAVIDWVLAEAVDIVEQDRLDQLGIHDKYGLEAEIVVDHDRLGVEVSPPAPHRIGDHAGEQLEKRQPPRGRPWHFDYGRV